MPTITPQRPSSDDEILRLSQEIAELKNALSVERRHHKEHIAQIEASAGESRERLALILKGTDIGIWELNIQTGELIDDEHWLQMLGYEAGEIESNTKSWRTLFHPDDFARMGKAFHALSEGKIPFYEDEYRIRHKSGSWVWVLDKGKIITRDSAGKPLWAAGIHINVTRRRQTEEALRDSESRFRSLVETTNDCVWQTDKEGVYTYMSPRVQAILGYEPEQVIGKKPFDFMPSAEAERVLALLKDIVDAARPFSGMENVNLHKDGRDIVLETNGVPILDAHGRLIGYHGIDRDITDRKRAEEALKESEEYMAQIINRIADPVFVMDRRHRFVLANDAMCAFTGWEREELLGRTIHQLNLPEEEAKFIWKQEDLIFEQGQELIAEEKATDAKGNIHTVISKKTLLTDKSGNQQIVGVLRDITEYKRLEAQFLQAQKMEAIGVLAGGVAHDFNNLLNVINGYSDLALEGLSQDHPIYKDIKQVREAGRRAASLTSQLLAFGRKQILQPETLELNSVIAEMNSMLRRLIGEDIEFVSKAQPGLGLIHVDPGQIQQIVMNLAVNARDAMRKGGKLIIETANVDFDETYTRAHPSVKAGSYVMLAISDTGIGMDATIQSHLFEPFFTTKEKGKGTGLGLSTVYGIVKQSNGFIWVESKPEIGTTFKIYFPFKTGEIGKAKADSKVTISFRGSETILVVEDEEPVRQLTIRILRERGYNVIEAQNGSEALRIARDYVGKIHLVLTDAIMPGIGGSELVSQLEVARPGIKSLCVSGYTDDAIIRHSILDSNIAFLQKPFTIDGLASKVREVIDS